MILEQNEKTKLVATDARWHDIGALPSQFHPYPWKKLYVRPFDVAELKLASRAVAMQDIRYMIRAVDMCITEDAGSLTQGDYFYVMAWIRLVSTPKTPLMVEWNCETPVLEHKETHMIVLNDGIDQPKDELDKYAERKCGTLNSELIHMVNFDTIDLPEVMEDLPEGFDYPRMRDYPDALAALQNPELKLLVPAIQHIYTDPSEVPGASWAEKVRIMETSKGLDVYETAQSLRKILKHGIVETCVLRCRNCRKTYPYTIDLNPLTFFQ